MKWSEISIHTTNEAIEPISNILHESGASGVVIEHPVEFLENQETRFGEIYDLDPNDYPEEGVIIRAYLPVNEFLGDTVNSIKASINNLVQYDINIGKNKVMISEVNEEDWATAWKKYYHPVKVSDKITIVPSWEKYVPASPDELIIELDPGMAFGTGTHPTTVLSIRGLEKTVVEGYHVIDVGTGSGVLSIAAAKLGAEKVTAFDLDEVAVSAARANAELNDVDSIISVHQNNLLDGVEEKSAHIVVANILAEIILKCVDDAAKVVKKDGYFITSGIISEKKEIVRQSLIEAGFEVIETLTMDDWVSFIAKRK